EAETPADGFDFFQAAEHQIESEANDANHDHGGDDKIVALAGIAGVDHQIAEAGIDSDHFGGNYDQPSDAERDAEAHNDLWNSGGENDFRQQRRGAEAEVASGAAKHRRHVADAVHGRYHNGKK